MIARMRTRSLPRLAAVLALSLVAVGLAPLGPEPAAAASDPGLGVAAPATIDRRILGAMHTDAVSAYVDDGQLVLGSKADFEPEGVFVEGFRLDPAHTVFNLTDAAQQPLPATPPEFLAGFGDRYWLAPQTQNHDLIWPGFSTTNASFVEAVGGANLALELVSVRGPGRVEIFTSDGFGGHSRLFSSADALPAWSLAPSQHSHANWAFSAPGRYDLTFRGTTQLGGVTQTAETQYTFVVGEVVAAGTGLQVSTPAAQLEPQTPVVLTATLTPTDARGAVEFVDRTTSELLGHAPVVDGVATLTVPGMHPGRHEIGAKFVPRYADEFVTVELPADGPLVIEVTGEVSPMPDHRDETGVTATDLAAPAGAGLKLRTVEVPAGSRVVAEVTDTSLIGSWVSLWLHGGSSNCVGWAQVSRDGTVSLAVPPTAGSYSVMAKAPDGALIGRDVVTVVAPSRPADPKPDRPAPGTGTTPGGNTGPGAGVPPAEASTCRDPLVLETGHIDAFNVSVGGGAAALQIKEDVTGLHTVREAENVLLRVKPEALRSIPGGYPGAPEGYVLPLTQDSALIWPGWDTNRTATSGYTDVRIDIHSVTGPGEVHLFTLAQFGGTTALLTHGGTALPGSVREAKPAHTHAQWVFTQTGIYQLQVSATATNPTTGASLTTATHTYVFQVGDAPIGDVFCHVVASAEAAATGASVQQTVADAERIAATQAGSSAAGASTASGGNAAGGGGSGGSSGLTGQSPLADALGITGVDPAVLGLGVGGGGTAILAGIALLVRWYLGRMRRLAEAESLP